MPHEIDVAALRARLRMTQRAFAEVYGIAFNTLRDWEHDRRQPDQTARTYLRVIAAKPASVRKAIAEPVRDGEARVPRLVGLARAVDAPKPGASVQPPPAAAARATVASGRVIARVPRIVEAAERPARPAVRPSSSGIRIRI